MRRLRELRQAKNMSQQKLAINLNLSQASISKYENGTAEPDIKTILLLSEYLNVSTDYLLEKTDFKIPVTKSDLKDDEIELLHNYRKLSNGQKGRVFAYLRGISEQ